ncbi:MAG: hypothetical protein C0515_12465 [Novosphingobium sp.]|nr:hypothetical protein [Novosphingobium sp.]MBX9645035.1 hypothetical protein [Novosphingobium sp.]
MAGCTACPELAPKSNKIAPLDSICVNALKRFGVEKNIFIFDFDSCAPRQWRFSRASLQRGMSPG